MTLFHALMLCSRAHFVTIFVTPVKFDAQHFHSRAKFCLRNAELKCYQLMLVSGGNRMSCLGFRR